MGMFWRSGQNDVQFTVYTSTSISTCTVVSDLLPLFEEHPCRIAMVIMAAIAIFFISLYHLDFTKLV